MKKVPLCSEAAYGLGMLVLALGNALMVYGNFGMSMVVAPAYVLYLWLSKMWPFFTFGMAEYLVQAVVLLALIVLMRRVKLAYFLSFGTTLLYGVVLDGVMRLTRHLPDVMWGRVAAFVGGEVLCAMGVAMLFCTYFPPGLYEVFVKELTDRCHGRLGVVKTLYDCGSLVVAVVLSLLLFGGLNGIGIGTVATALVNGTLIHLFCKWYERVFVFKDAFPWRGFFEEKR